jgi:ribonuclease BN (tRNA processing enzyme)
VPKLVLDAGTGLSVLPTLLCGRAFSGQIILSHLHWDHVQGLPFCSSIDRPDAEVTLRIPVSGSESNADAYALLARAFAPPHFPITPDGLQGEWTFTAMRGGPVADGITAQPIAHKGGVAYGLRVDIDGAVVAYLPDHALHAGTDAAERESARQLINGADVVVHDGQFTADEGQVAAAYGHATIESVLELADSASIGMLVLTHHSPTRTDEQLDQLASRFRTTPGGRSVTFARQGVAICA